MVRVLQRLFPTLLVIFLMTNTVDVSAGVIYAENLFGEEYGTGFRLHWATAKEVETQLFVVERSSDGLNFSAIGAIPAAGDANEEQDYEFIDLELGIVRGYYRLKQIDKDGTSSLTEPILLSRANAATFQIVSNQKNIKDILYVNIQSIDFGMVECTIFNAAGDIILLKKQSVRRGLNEFAFDMSHENEGNYSVTFQKDRSIATHVFYKEADAVRKMDNTASRGRRD